MSILSILRTGEEIFVEDKIEDKKVRQFVDQVNASLANAVVELDAFNSFAESQLSGEYHDRLVMAKSLRLAYESWSVVATAYSNLQREEENQVNRFYTFKTKLINSLNELAKLTAKSPVVSCYDVFDGELQKCPEGHNVIILGEHGANVIATIVAQLEEELQAVGHFVELEAKDLTANYAMVTKNVNSCNEKLEELFGGKAGKLAKFQDAVNKMQEIGQKAVFFLTYKDSLLDIGCSKKELDLYEKNIVKNYMPLKKLLQKTCKFTFEEICDIVVDEENFATADEENLEATYVNEENTAEANVEFTQEEVEGEPLNVEEVAQVAETTEAKKPAKKFDFKGLASKVNASKSEE